MYHLFFHHNEVLRNKYNKSFYVRIEAGASMTTGRWHLSVQQLKSSFFIPKSKRKKHYTSFFRAVFSASIASFWVVNDCISTLSGRISPSNCWIWETTMLTCWNNYCFCSREWNCLSHLIKFNSLDSCQKGTRWTVSPDCIVKVIRWSVIGFNWSHAQVHSEKVILL